MERKYKVGDKVRIVNKLPERASNYELSMEGYKEIDMILVGYKSNGFYEMYQDDGRFDWSDEMIDHVIEHGNVSLKYDVGDKVRINETESYFCGEYNGKDMTIRSVTSRFHGGILVPFYIMEEDKHKHFWQERMIQGFSAEFQDKDKTEIVSAEVQDGSVEDTLPETEPATKEQWTKLNPIKPGMVIHCKTHKEYKRLNEETRRLGFGELPVPFSKNHLYIIHEGDVLWSVIENREYIEFSDLIISDLTAKEVLQICAEICDNRDCEECPMKGGNCFRSPASDKEEIIEICQQWKSDHEKKEPEIEWVYRVFGAENYGEKFFQTEDEAIKRCEELAKSQKTNQYTRYERVCRIKEEK